MYPGWPRQQSTPQQGAKQRSTGWTSGTLWASSSEFHALQLLNRKLKCLISKQLVARLALHGHLASHHCSFSTDACVLCGTCHSQAAHFGI
jgi:hypothetical protein